MVDKKALRPFKSFPFDEFDAQSGVSVSDDKTHIYVEAQLPGLKAEDIEISYEKGMLWISGEKKEEEEDKKKRYYRRASSSFSYQIHVPCPIDEKKEPDAVYQDGVLRVSFSKTSEKAKKITIKRK